MTTTLTCTIKPSIIAWWFHAVLTRPYVRTDDEAVHTRWGRRTTVELTDGPTVSVGFSYRRLWHQRFGETTVPLPDSEPHEIRARLGPLNSSNFRVEVV